MTAQQVIYYSAHRSFNARPMRCQSRGGDYI